MTITYVFARSAVTTQTPSSKNLLMQKSVIYNDNSENADKGIKSKLTFPTEIYDVLSRQIITVKLAKKAVSVVIANRLTY